MNKHKHPRKSKLPHEYRPEWILRVLFILAMALFVAIAWGLLGKVSTWGKFDDLDVAFILGFFVPFWIYTIVQSWAAVHYAFLNRLIIWDSGVEAYHYGRHIFVLWEDLDRLDWYYTRTNQKWLGLYFYRAERESVSLFGRLWGGRPMYIPMQDYVRVSWDRYVASYDIKRRYKDCPLVQDMLQHSPDLIDDEVSRIREALGLSCSETRYSRDTAYIAEKRTQNNEHA